MIDTFIFDIDGVVRTLKEIPVLDLLSDELRNKYSLTLSGLSLREFSKICYGQNPAHELFDKGLIDDVDYLAKTKLKDESLMPAFEYLYSTNFEVELNVYISETIEFIKFLKKNGYKIYALSDMYISIAKLLKKDIGEYFDDIIFSCDVHMKKPSLEVFEYAISRWNIDPKTSLFIDDSERNLTAFKSLGGNVFLFNPKTPNDCIKKIKDLISKN